MFNIFLHETQQGGEPFHMFDWNQIYTGVGKNNNLKYCRQQKIDLGQIDFVKSIPINLYHFVSICIMCYV